MVEEEQAAERERGRGGGGGEEEEEEEEEEARMIEWERGTEEERGGKRRRGEERGGERRREEERGGERRREEGVSAAANEMLWHGTAHLLPPPASFSSFYPISPPKALSFQLYHLLATR